MSEESVKNFITKGRFPSKTVLQILSRRERSRESGLNESKKLIERGF
jgi:hypothetical protein